MKKTTAKTTTPTNQLRDRCQSHFLTLRIPVEPAALDELLARAEKESLSHLHFLDLLLGAQADARRERAVARRIRDAHFAENKTLEGFNWEFNPKAFDRVQIDELATGDFIRRQESHHSGTGAESVPAWLSRFVSDFGSVTRGPDSLACR
jgi:IstB-like ATP binding protein